MYCCECDGYMVERESKYGKFFGCSNLPVCENKVRMHEVDEYVNSEEYLTIAKKRKEQEKKIEAEFENYCPNYARNGDCISDKSDPSTYGFKCTGNYSGDYTGCNRQDRDGR